MAMTDDRAPASWAVLLPLPLAGAYDYLAPPELDLVPGDFVRVPLGRREAIGVVWGKPRGDVAPAKLRPILAKLDLPPLAEALRQFLDRVAAYTMSPPGAVLRMSMSVASALEPPRPQILYRAAASLGQATTTIKLTPSRRKLLDYLAEGRPLLSASDLAREAGVGPGVVKGLIEAGMVEPVARPPQISFPMPDHLRAGPLLEAAQREAAAALRARVEAGGYSVTLLDGVTGAGKTEVYFEAIAATLAQGRQALVLLPEIALSTQWLERFERRFGVRPAEWHSDLGGVERRNSWRAVAEGKAPVLVGARSALFLPFPDLGLIVVDEEHEPAFKQEDGVIYQARDMAVLRAHQGQFPAMLVSATPALESLQNVQQGRYRALHLADRFGGASLPKIAAIDLRRDRPARQSWLSPSLTQAVARTLAAGEQALLFLNRRGYAPLTLCRQCGHRFRCPHCSAWLVEHRFRGRLQCHHCGHQASLPNQCPSCAAEGSFAACGPGVERLYEEARAAFRQARIEIITSDTVIGPSAAEEWVRRLANHEVDLLIGTQIVAKGHHFPMLTLVGVVDGDLGLAGGDLRAAERTYQLLHQVAGRAGRAERPGRVLIQTVDPGHPVMQALINGDRDRFLAEEAADRLRNEMPPFGRLAAVILSGHDPGAVDRLARDLAAKAPVFDGVTILGPAPAPLALLRGRHRRRFLVKCRRDVAPQPVLKAWLGGIKLKGTLRLQIDIDPYSFL